MSPTDDLKTLQQHANKGEAWAQNNLGRRYSDGQGVAQDDVQAVAWYRRAAEQDYAWGQANLGFMYRNGRGVAKDVEQAQRWFERALINADADDELRTRVRNNLALLNGVVRDRDVVGDSVGSESVTSLKVFSQEVCNVSDTFASTVVPWGQGGINFTTVNVENFARPSAASSEPGALDQALAAVESMIGLDSVKSELRDLADYVSVQQQRRDLGLKTPDLSLHLVFTGNPGTGKTTVARHVGAIYRAMGLLKSGHVVEVKREDLVGGYLGETPLKTKAKIEEALDGVLFVDEAYALAPAKLTYHDYGTEAIATLLAEMENNRSRLAVIAAGYTDEMAGFIANNPGLKSRFTRYLEFPDYTPENLIDIFQSMATDGDYVITDALRAALLEQFAEMYAARAKDFGNGRSARNLYEKVLERHGRRVARLKKPGRDVLTTLTVEDLTGQAGPGSEKPLGENGKQVGGPSTLSSKEASQSTRGYGGLISVPFLRGEWKD